MEKSRVISFKNKLCVLLVSLAILLGVVFSFKSTSVTKVDAITTSDTTSYVKVGELFNTNTKQFDKTNYQILKNYLAGKVDATASDIDNLKSLGRNFGSSLIRQQTLGAGSYNGVNYLAKSNTQDIVVRLGGLDWQVVYLSKDKSDNSILTLWLDNCVQEAWTTRSVTEGEHYGFYNGGLFGDYNNNWTANGDATLNYPANMYGTSYLNAVILNNGGMYSINNSQLSNAIKSSSSAFALFTMEQYGLTDYLVTPRQVDWQEYQSLDDELEKGYDISNEAWAKDVSDDNFWFIENYASKNYSDAWSDSYLWIPSLTEVGDGGMSGLWSLSSAQTVNYDGTTENIVSTVGSEGGPVYTYTWLRSTCTYNEDNTTDLASAFRTDGSRTYNCSVYSSLAVRPALHLNLNDVEISANRESIADGSISFTSSTNSVFDGTMKSIDVIVNSKTLGRGLDYTTSYQLGGKTVMAIYDAGTYTVTVTGKGNYYGTLVGQITVTAAPLVGITLDKTSVTYSGMNIIVSETVSAGDVFGVLNKNVDYAITYSTVEGAVVNELKSANTYKIRATGKGNFTGAVSATFTIERKSIAGASFTCSSATYTGSAVEPPTMTMILDDGSPLRYGTDYSIKYYDSGISINPSLVIDAITYTVTATGNGNYKDSVSTTFTINPRDISTGSITLASNSLLYWLDPILVEEVIVDSESLILDTDYTMEYRKGSETGTVVDDPVDVGTYYIVLTGQGNYTGTLSTSFTINSLAVSDTSITVASIANQTYTGSAINPLPVIKHNTKTLVKDTDYTLSYSNNTKAGEATVTITGIGNFSGSRNVTFTIEQLDVSGATLSISNVTYTGKVITPIININIGLKPVISGQKIVTYKKNDMPVLYLIDVGTYTATVTFTENSSYKGSLTTTFQILQKDISSIGITIKSDDSASYTGDDIIPSYSISCYGSQVLVKGQDYELTYYTEEEISETSIRDVGTYYVDICGKGNYSGVVRKTFVVELADIGDATFSTISAQTFTGSAITPLSVIKHNSQTLVEGIDYTLSYSNNTNAGEATVTITGKGNFSGSKEIKFAIKPKSCTGMSFTFPNLQYTGSAVELPTIVVSLDGKTLENGIDYIIKYRKGGVTGDFIDPSLIVEVGYYGVDVVGMGNYVGSSGKRFEVTPLSITDESITVEDIATETYTGSSITPLPVVKHNGITLVKDTDYTLTYLNNTNSGTATITIEGKGNFTGSREVKFDIKPIEITIDDININSTEFVYGGFTVYVINSIVVDNVTLEEGFDYFTIIYDMDKFDGSNLEECVIDAAYAVGNYKLVVVGNGNYEVCSPIEIEFEIKPLSISDASVFVDTIENQVYTGSEIKPGLMIVFEPHMRGAGGAGLIEGTDYTLTYEDNVNAGTASVTITGIGNFTGERVVEFTINQLTIEGGELTFEDLFSYTGLEIIPEVTLVVNGITLEKDRDYLVVASNNIGFGNANLSVTGKGNYTGTINSTFYIAKAALSDVVIDSIPTQNYTGSEITPVPNITYNTRPLSLGVDFECTYDNNINVGTATIVIIGKGNFDGREEVTFEIGSQIINSFTLGATSFVYDTVEKTPGITVKSNGEILQQDRDYTVSGDTSATNVGNYTITVVGKGGYTGTMTATWAITARGIGDCVITIDDGYYPYTGSEYRPNVTIVTSVDEYVISDSDYVLEYTDNIDAGTAKITITGTGNLAGSLNRTFTIEQKTLLDDDITATIEKQIYTGAEIEPEINIIYNGMKLVLGEDYTCDFADNIDVTTEARVLIIGQGNYSAIRVVNFEIEARDIAECEIILSAYELTYFYDRVHTVTVEVKYGDTVIDSSNYTINGNVGKNAGTYNVVVTGKNNLTGENNSQSFVVAPRMLIEEMITEIRPQQYLHDGYGNAIPVTLEYYGDSRYDEVLLRDPRDLIFNVDYTIELVNATSIYEDETFQTPGDIPTAIFTGIGNYTGTISSYFIIYDNNLATDTTMSSVSISTETHCFTNGEIKPKVTVVWAGNTLSADGENPDYKVEYSNNINVGEATVTITGLNSYNGVVTKTFEITPIDIDCVTFDFGDNYYEYNGSAHNPAFTLEYNSTSISCEYCVNESCLTANGFMLLDGTHYTCEVTNNVNAGEGIVTCTGMGNFTGTTTGTFVICPRGITNGGIEDLTVNAFEYTGQEITPSVVVFYNDGEKIILEKDKDYSVYYENNINVGEATIVVRGIGNYDGELSKDFTIYAKEIETIALDTNSYYYDATSKTPVVTVKVGDKVLVNGADYEVTGDMSASEAGTYTIVVTGKGNYTGELTAEWTIAPIDISPCYITIDESDLVYTGAEIRPNVIIKVSENGAMISSDMYTIAYSENINVGGGKAVITGKGNLTGEVTKTFEIAPRNLSDVQVATIPNQQFTGSEIVPEVVVAFNGTTLEKDRDYTLTYSNNINAGAVATIEITGKGNYTGKTTKNFTILANNISSATLTIENNTFVYTGSAIDTKEKVVYNGVELEKDNDYYITIRLSSPAGEIVSEAKNAGNYYLVITGISNYTGSKFVGFNVVKATPNVTVVCKDSVVFAGKPVQLEVTNSTVAGVVYCSQTSYIEGEFDYEYMFVPTDTANYNAVVGSIKLTAVKLEIVGLAFSGDYKTEYVAYETLNTANLVVSLKYNNDETQELYLTEYTFSMLNGAILRVGDKVTISYIHNREIKADLPITIAPRKVVASFENNLVDNGDAQEIVFNFANEVLDAPVTYTAVYYNLSTGLIVENVVHAGKYKAIITLTNNNYTIEENEVLFEVYTRSVSSENEEVYVESDSGFATDENFSFEVKTDEKAVLKEIGISSFDTEKQFVSVYTFNLTEDKDVVITLSLDIKNVESVSVYKIEDNTLISLPCSVVNGNQISVACNTKDKLYIFSTPTYVVNTDRVDFVSAIVVLLAIIVVGLVMTMVIDSKKQGKLAKKLNATDNVNGSNNVNADDNVSDEEIWAKYVIIDSDGNVVGLRENAPEELRQAFSALTIEQTNDSLDSVENNAQNEEIANIEPETQKETDITEVQVAKTNEQPVQENVVNEQPKLTDEEMVARYTIIDENGNVIGLKEGAPEELKQAYGSLLNVQETAPDSAEPKLTEEEMIAKYVIVDENGKVVGLRDGAPEELKKTYEALLNNNNNN